MASIPWRAAARQSCWRKTFSTPPARPHIYRRLQTKGRPPNANCTHPSPALRRPSLRSRALGQSPSQPRNHAAVDKAWNWNWKRWAVSPSARIQPLESRFPAKTVVAVLLVGGLLYWVNVKFVIVNGFEPELYRQYNPSDAYGPLQHLPTPEAVEHHLQHVVEMTTPTTYTGYYSRLEGDQELQETACGWRMTEVDAQRWCMPLTHGCRAASNTPCEDYFSLGSAPGPGAELWNFWGIYDGHVGHDMSRHLHLMLISAVSQALGVLPLSTSSPAIANAIMQAFVREDDRIMRLARSAATWHQPVSPQAYYALGPAMSGSCALLSMYDPKSCTLRVANTGDSRAVLGRWDAESGGYTCIPLSEDQNGFNPDEVSRIKEAHPGEDEILDPATGRLLGMAVTRAFGNHRWKWDDDMVRKVKAKFFGVGPCPHLKTPPYMTAEPVVKEVQVVSVDAEEENRRGTNAKSDFLIMASDGLWGYMSSEDAVLLVQRWLEARERGNGIVQADPQLEQRLTADREKRNKSVEEQLGYKPEDVGYVGWRATPEFFAVEDENAAICLYRNVLGGTRRWLQAGLRYMPQSIRRNAIDDTTIMVVFFDKLGQEGQMQKVTGEVTGKAKNWWWPWFSPWYVPLVNGARRGR